METLDFEETIDDYKRRIFDLNTMLELGKTLNASLSLKDVLDIVILTCNGHFHSSDAVILLATDRRNDSDNEYTLEAENISIKSSDPFIEYIHAHQMAIQLQELKENKEMNKTYKKLLKNDIDLVMPLRYKNKINGILCLKKKEEEFGTYYTEDEKRYIDIIAGFASVAIENARLYEIATLDMKTRLFNHGYFQNRLIEEIGRAERYKTDLTLMILDLDHFKRINDTYGHMMGDEVLIMIAETIRTQVRECDIPARFGGEEFTVILPETDDAGSLIVAERLRKSIKHLEFSAADGDTRNLKGFGITVSIGLSGYSHASNMTEDILIENADKALYQAKQNGRDQVVYFQNKKIVNPAAK